MDITAQTLVLVDNSLSVSKPNREITKYTLQYLFTHTEEGRSYCFSTFSHEMDYVESYTDDYAALEDMASRVEYENKETSITDVLSSVLDKWEKSDFACRDVLIVTDGLEEKSLYYEKEELYYLLQHCSYPVYVICLDQKGNEDKVKNLSVITRLSGGELFHTEFEDSEAEIERKLSEQVLHSMDSYAKAHWAVYEEDSKEGDAAEETSDLSETENQSTEALTINGLRIGINDENGITDVINADKSDDYALSGPGEEENVIYEMQRSDGFGTPISYAVIGASTFVVICVIALIACLIIRYKKNLEKEDEEYKRIIREKLRQDQAEMIGNYGNDNAGNVNFTRNCGNSTGYRGNLAGNSNGLYIGDTVALVNRESGEEEYSTRLLFGDSEYKDVTFEDANDPSKFYRIALRGKIILGRLKSKCDLAFEYDDSVSSKHCEMYSRDGRFYVRDLDSSNGTLINGEKVFTENELSSGDMLQLGSLMLIVRFT